MVELSHLFGVQAKFFILLISCLIQVFAYLSSDVFYKRYAPDRKAALKYATICCNSGFIGNPLVEGIYGSLGLMYGSVYLIPQRICMWSAGVSCFTKVKGAEAAKKVIKHPCIIATVIGLVILLFQIPIPNVVYDTLKSLSTCTTALSMIIIGGMLSEIEVKTTVNIHTLYFCAIRLIVIPLTVLAVCMAFSITPLVTAVSTVLVGTPAGTTTALFAAKYDGDEKFAVKLVFLLRLLWR